MLPGSRMRDRNLAGVEKDPRELRLRRGAVQRVTDHRMADRREVDPDLVGAPGADADLEERKPGPFPDDPEICHGGPSFPDLGRHPYAVAGVPADGHLEPGPARSLQK